MKRVSPLQGLAMKGTQLLPLLLLGAASALPQTYAMHKDVESAIVWQGDCHYEKLGSANFDVDKYLSHTPTCAAETTPPNGAVASMVVDPLTGHRLRKLTWNGIEVTSTLETYFRAVWNWHQSVTARLRVINNTGQSLEVRPEGFHATLPFASQKEIDKAFKKGTPPLFQPWTIPPGRSGEFYAILYVPEELKNGRLSLRYSIRVGSRDWVFPWAPLPTEPVGCHPNTTCLVQEGGLTAQSSSR